MPNARKSDFFLLFLNQFVWGSSWSAIKSAQAQVEPVALNVWSLGISAVALYPFVHRQLRQEPKPQSIRELVDYAAMGVLGVAGMALLYAWGTKLALAANGALISTSVPVLTALVAGVVLGERLTILRVASLGVALAGVFLLSDLPWGEVDFSRGHLFANLLLLGGSLCNATYVVYSKKLLARVSPISLLFWGQLLGFLGALPFLWVEGFRVGAVAGYTWRTWLALAFLGLVFYDLTMIVFFKILVRLDAGQIMVSTYLQPVIGVIVAALTLGEKITPAMIVSGLLVLGATAMATYGDSWRLRPGPAAAGMDPILPGSAGRSAKDGEA